GNRGFVSVLPISVGYLSPYYGPYYNGLGFRSFPAYTGLSNFQTFSTPSWFSVAGLFNAYSSWYNPVYAYAPPLASYADPYIPPPTGYEPVYQTPGYYVSPLLYLP